MPVLEDTDLFWVLFADCCWFLVLLTSDFLCLRWRLCLPVSGWDARMTGHLFGFDLSSGKRCPFPSWISDLKIKGGCCPLHPETSRVFLLSVFSWLGKFPPNRAGHKLGAWEQRRKKGPKEKARHRALSSWCSVPVPQANMTDFKTIRDTEHSEVPVGLVPHF